MKGTDQQKDHVGQDVLEELFQQVSARERPARDEEQAIRRVLHEEWKQLTNRRRRRRALAMLATAASLVIAVMVTFSLTGGPEPVAPAIQLAEVQKVVGKVQIRQTGTAEARMLDTASALEAGQRITTGSDSRLALKWLNGESIRLDNHTDVRLDEAGQLTLLTGRIYVDTDDVVSLATLLIRTPSGEVRHLGTRYMTTVSVEGTSVSVRDGRVLLEAGGTETIADRGEQVKVGVSGVHSLKPIPTYGVAWEWIQQIAPAFSPTDRSISGFLAWVSRETGREIEYGSPEAENLARDTLLHGRVEMEPMRALAVILQTSDLVAEVYEGTIRVGLRMER